MDVRLVTLQLVSPWKIAHGTSTERETVILELDEGVGEAAVVPYLGESADEIRSAIYNTGADGLPQGAGGEHEGLGVSSTSLGARCALELALHDIEARRRGVPLWNAIGISSVGPIETSFSIAMDTPDEMAARARASGASILKLKMGGPDDEDCVEAVRGATNASLRLDANGGWSRERAAQIIPRLARFKIELVEQPLPVRDREGFAWLRAQGLGVPMFADESAGSVADVDELAPHIDGVVIKVRKLGGITPALAAIARARAHGLRTMIGCMIESSLAVTAAAHLAPLCDLADLDAPLLIRNDPFAGLSYHGTTCHLPTAAGIGVLPRDPR